MDAANDLALLKADGKFSPLPISSSRSAQLGGTVATVGFPDIGLQGFAPKLAPSNRFFRLLQIHALNYFTGLAKGEIASLSGAGDDLRYFQISAPVQPGNSGGALVDERGNVIGIVSAKVLAHGHHGGNRYWEVELRPGDDPHCYRKNLRMMSRGVAISTARSIARFTFPRQDFPIARQDAFPVGRSAAADRFGCPSKPVSGPRRRNRG